MNALLLPTLLLNACTGKDSPLDSDVPLVPFGNNDGTFTVGQWNIGLSAPADEVVEFVSSTWMGQVQNWGGIELWAEDKYNDIGRETSSYYDYSFYYNDAINPRPDNGNDTTFGAGLAVYSYMEPNNIYGVSYLDSSGNVLCDDNDCIGSKGYIVESHDYQGGTLAIITTHLQANNSDDGGQGQEVRIEQLALLAEEINTLRADGVEYIVVRGDFNVSLNPYNGAEVAIDQFLADTGLSQVCAEITCDDWETIRDQANASNSSTSDDLVWGNYDHFFYTAETLEPFDHQFHVPQDEEGRNVSDHLPRQVSFRPI